MIILDFGSGNTCKNRPNYIRRMITELARVRTTKEVVIKWQLFNSSVVNMRLSHRLFETAYLYAAALGFRTTASVFDQESLDYLLTFDVPFVKIANQPASKALETCVGSPGTLVSTNDPKDDRLNVMYCISEYPADKQKYIDTFGDKLREGISDHTTDFELYNTYQPRLYECHYKLEDSTGLDAGPFARTPKQLEEILK